MMKLCSMAAGRSAALLALVLPLALGSVAPAARADGGQVFRCPGPPVLYTDALTPEEAREKGCRTIDGAPITVIQTSRPRPPVAAGTTPASGAKLPDAKVDGNTQRQRDSDARRILETELKREEDRLAQLKQEYNNGEPERRGNERNYQTYLDRVAQMKAGISRAEADIAAIRREIAKLPQ